MGRSVPTPFSSPVRIGVLPFPWEEKAASGSTSGPFSLPTRGPDTEIQTLTWRSPLVSNFAPSRCTCGTRAASPLRGGRLEEATLGARAGLTGYLPDSLAQSPELHVDVLVQIYCHLPKRTKQGEAAEHGLANERRILKLDVLPTLLPVISPPCPRLIITRCLGGAACADARAVHCTPWKMAPFT